MNAYGRDLDRDGGEGTTGWAGSRGDVVVGRARHPSHRDRPGSLAGNLGRRDHPRPFAGVLDREQRGQQPLACPDPAAGRRRPASLPIGCAEGRRRNGRQRLSGFDRPPEFAGSNRIGRGRSARPGRTRRQPDDDGQGRLPRLNLRRLLPDRRPSFRRPPRGRRPAAEPFALSRDRGRPGRRPPPRLVRRASPLGRSSITRGPRTS